MDILPSFISYGRQQISEFDCQAVLDVLQSDWLTGGPKVAQFEEAVSIFCGVRHGVAVSSGTAALHSAMFALQVGPGDEVLVPCITFAATANCVVYQGARPVFVDVKPETLLMDAADLRNKITSQTKAIIAVDYAGQPCDYQELRAIADEFNLALVADGCHALGAEDKAGKVGTLADMTVFSFHPVKHITTGEGGMVVTDNREYVERMRCFRNHGITSDQRQRQQDGTWLYDMVDLGFNYRLSDLQCALGISQLRQLPAWLVRRQEVACLYDDMLAGLAGVVPLSRRSGTLHAFHLYVVKLGGSEQRATVFTAMRQANIGVNVHYRPVHLHPYYQEKFATVPGQCPHGECCYEQILSLPMHPGLADEDVQRVVACLAQAIEEVGQ